MKPKTEAMNKWFVDYVNRYKGFKTFKIFLSPICRAVLIRSEGLKSIGLCFTSQKQI